MSTKPKIVHQPSQESTRLNTKPTTNQQRKQSKPKSQAGCSNTQCLIIFIIVLIVLIPMIIFWNQTSKKFLDWLWEKSEEVAKMEEPRRSLIYCLIYYMYHFSGMLLESAFSVSTAYFLGNFWHPMLLLVFTQMTSALLSHIICKKCCQKWLKKKFEKKLLYKILVRECKNNPYKICSFFRFLFIQATIKNFMLPNVQDISLFTNLVCLFPFLLFYGTIYFLVGLNLKSMEDYFESGGFSDLNVYEKIKFIFGWVVLVGSIICICFMCFYTRSRMRELQRKLEEDEQGVNGGEGENDNA